MNTIYIVYSQNESHFDDLAENTYQLKEHWFTNEEQAELCAEYLNMSGDTFGYFSVAEVTNGDRIDYKSLIKEEERKQKEREIRREKEIRLKNVDNYALLKSRVEGLNYYDTVKELREKYLDYIEGKE